jgi:hypothetical protein
MPTEQQTMAPPEWWRGIMGQVADAVDVPMPALFQPMPAVEPVQQPVIRLVQPARALPDGRYAIETHTATYGLTVELPAGTVSAVELREVQGALRGRINREIDAQLTRRIVEWPYWLNLLERR